MGDLSPNWCFLLVGILVQDMVGRALGLTHLLSLIKSLFDYSQMIYTRITQYRAPNRRNYTFTLTSFGEKAKTSCTAEFRQSKKQPQKRC